MKIAMWSGPRNLSTALMYSFGQRADFHVVDEPFYGPYLRMTGLPHPMHEEIMRARPKGANAVEQSLKGPIPDGKPHAYHKHMCQHMIDGIPRGFMAQCVNVFLIRHPARVVDSFKRGYAEAKSTDLGYAKQTELFRHVYAQGKEPVVIDSADIRDAPETMLRALCKAIELEFDPAMLSWPAGPRDFDGIWAQHWYRTVHASTGFAGTEGPLPELDAEGQRMAAAAMPHYEMLKGNALTPDDA